MAHIGPIIHISDLEPKGGTPLTRGPVDGQHPDSFSHLRNICTGTFSSYGHVGHALVESVHPILSMEHAHPLRHVREVCVGIDGNLELERV